jgi:phage shock protein PspC (stress-responsive transcriptional regulator)
MLSTAQQAGRGPASAKGAIEMPDSTNLILRDDTFLGICAGLGEDLGFDPNWLRVPLAVSLLWNPTAVVAIYLSAGVLVLLSRLIAPNPRPAAQPAAETPAIVQAEAELEPEPLSIAA